MFLLSDEEFDKLMLNLGIQKGAKLNYREFLKRFEHVETVEEGHAQSMPEEEDRTQPRQIEEKPVVL